MCLTWDIKTSIVITQNGEKGINQRYGDNFLLVAKNVAMQTFQAHLTKCLSCFFQFAAKILIFYLIFYAVLTAFFIGLWCLFATTLTLERPKYELKDSIIGDNPGLGFRPMPPESNVESTLIWYQKDNETNVKYWVKEIDSFLDGEMTEFT